jgi:hypothetical protein
MRVHADLDPQHGIRGARRKRERDVALDGVASAYQLSEARICVDLGIVDGQREL